jgi:TatA/E family protein of Tat protein translocase
MFSNIGTGEIIVVVLVALLIFGPRKLPEIARNFGRLFITLKSLIRMLKMKSRAPSKRINLTIKQCKSQYLSLF